MHPDIHTQLIALLGTPLSQSYAADMQNSAYEAMGANLFYFYEEMDATHLGEVVNGLRYMHFAGFAVTKPNKIAIMPYLDEVDPLCELIGSCNTVVIRDHRLIGYNTDATGFIRALTERFDVRNARCACLGTGGVGRAICAALVMHGADRVLLQDVNPEAAQAVAERLNGYRPNAAQVAASDDWNALAACDLVINATGLGVTPNVGCSPLPAEVFRKETFYFDAGYNPAVTRFGEYALAAGAPFMNGLEMSLYQGVDQIRLWTGREAPVETMRRLIKEKAAPKDRL